MKKALAIALIVVGLTVFGVSRAQELWSIYQPACNANGIPDETCLCSMDEVVQKHGETAARYVGLDMMLRYDEAGPLLEQVGEDEAFAASVTFEESQYRECSSGRLERLRGTYQNPGASTIAEASVATAVAGAEPMPEGNFQLIDAFASGVPVMDLRQFSGVVIADVSALFIEASLLTGGANSSLRNFLGFYIVVDLEGGIDTNGDGAADLRPGDEGYSAEVQKRSMPTKLYVSENGGLEQVLGEARFDGGAMYAFYVRMKSDRANQGLMGSLNTANQMQSMQDLMRAMQTPQHLFFVFGGANAESGNHIVALGNNVFGFSISPVNPGAATDYDAQFTFRIGM